VPVSVPPFANIVALRPLHLPRTHSSVNGPVVAPLPSTAMWYVVPATALNAADDPPWATVVSALTVAPV
jgi:hypothetical protein